jgi:hypothetical protein
LLLFSFFDSFSLPFYIQLSFFSSFKLAYLLAVLPQKSHCSFFLTNRAVLYRAQPETAAMSARAIWYVAATKKSAQSTLYMHCNVKPGVSKNREGVASVSEEAVEICVAAQAREGEANKAVIKVLSEVRSCTS